MASTHVFVLHSESSASPTWGTAVALGASLGRLSHLMLYNKNSSAVVEYSFDGTNLHGELDPADGTRGKALDGISEASIYFRIKTGSSGPAVVSVEAWS